MRRKKNTYFTAVLAALLGASLACNLPGSDPLQPGAPPEQQSDSPTRPVAQPTNPPDTAAAQAPEPITPQLIASLDRIVPGNVSNLGELLTFEPGAISDFSWSPDSSTLAIAYFDRPHIELWNIFVGESVAEIGQLSPAVLSVSYAPFNDWIVTADESQVELWDIQSGNKLENIDEPGIRIIAVEFSPDGRTIAIGYESVQGSVVLWDQPDGEAIGVYFHDDWVTDLAFAPFGKLLASSAANGTVKVIDAVGTQTEILNLTHGSWVDSVALAFPPDGAGVEGHILATSASGEIKLWDTVTGQVLHTLAGHQEDVLSMSFSPDGQLLASASRDGTVKLWDVVTGMELATLIGHAGEVLEVAFSPDGMLLGSASLGGTLMIWAVGR